MPEIQEEEIDLREYINVLLKRKGVVILIFLIAVIAAALVSYFYLKPVYEANTILMISKPKYQVELEPKIQTQFTPEVSLATYESLIKDREIEEEVIKKLNLDQPPYEFTPDSLQGMITIESLKNTNLIKMNLQVGEPKLAKDIANVWAALFVEKNKDLNLQESKEAQGFIEKQLKISSQNLSKIEEEIREFNETNKIDAMDKEITVKLDKIMENESRLADVKITIKKEEANIERIFQQLLQKRVECYQSKKADIELSIFKEKTNLSQIQKQLEEQDKIIILSKSIVEDQFYKQLIEKISESDSIALNKLKLENEELNPLFTGLKNKRNSTILSLKNKEAENQKLTEIIAFLDIKLQEVNLSQDEQVQSAGIESLISIIDTTLFEVSKVDISSFEDTVSRNLKQKLVDGIILIKSLDAEMFQLKENINEAWKRVNLLKQELAQEKLTQSRLEREYNTAKGVYSVLSQKNEEVKIAVATESGLVKIASLAYEPRFPIKPNKKLNILIAGVLGLFVGIFVAFFLEFWQKGK
ncbi:MAG TPA: hypothetical protein ENG48_00505 [Candidatus Atribacteria bacterium]|nr:hypothetical protein [Candidatus Atribacteria bacterium]